MLSFFPTLYPDELLYSALARYHIRSGNKSFRQTDIELFGFHSQQLSKVTLTNNLNYLVNNLPFYSRKRVDHLLCNHTLYPFYASFLTQQEIFLLGDSIKKKFHGSVFEIAKLSLKSTGNEKKFLKFCPVCLEEEIQQYGEPYWHRSHQIPGIYVCLNHNSFLHDSTVMIETKGIHYHAASSENCLRSDSQFSDSYQTLTQLLILAKDIEWLISSNFCFQGLSWLRNQYQSYLIKREFLTVLPGNKLKLHETELCQSIFEMYSQDFLSIVNINFIRNPAKYLSHCLLACDVNPVIDRITHILMIKFLANSLEWFFI
ncbi:TniQ family protein [Nostoc linckia FACHB-104]|nr:TniQ family protein [Nostoc linckia FACHB-104]